MCFPTPEIPEIETPKPPPEPPKAPQAPADAQTDSDIVKKAKGTKALKIDLNVPQAGNSGLNIPA